MKNNIFDFVLAQDCCGCGACVNVCPAKAIMYSENKFGFIVPKIDSSECVNCGKCIEVCPIKNVRVKHPLGVYAAMNNNSRVLEMSSSGGIFSQLALEVLHQNGLVFGCTMDENFKVKHIGITIDDDLKKIAKSKYVQSFLGTTFSEIKVLLKSGQLVLFAGTPCQVAALNNFIGDAISTKLITVDIVCHGVPSQKLFDSYIKVLEEKRGKKLIEYVFRYKRHDKEGINWYSFYRYENGHRVLVNWPEDSYNFYYMKGATYRNSCYSCKYAQIERPGDITLCDYWGYEKKYREFDIKKDSVSGVIINTQKGMDLFQKIETNLKVHEVDLQHIADNNGCLQAPSKKIHFPEGNILKKWLEYGYNAIDREFMSKYRKQRIKYKIMRHIPKKVIYMLKR